MTKLQPQGFEIYNKSVEAFQHYLKRNSVCIITHKGDDIETIGSGTCIKIGTRFLISTAAHVIEDHKPEHLAIFTIGKIKKVHSSIVINRYFAKDVSKSIDLGILEINPKLALSLGLDFLSESQLDQNPKNLTEDVIALYGFPGSLVKIPAERHYLFQPFTYTTVCKDSKAWHKGVIKSQEIEIEYPTTAKDSTCGAFIDLPDAPGMSGGGVWKFNIVKNRNVWAPESANLIGILTHWHKTERWVRANRIGKWLSLVNEKFK